MKHSVVKRPNSESSSCSPVAAPRKRIRQSAGGTEIENARWIFLFNCIFSSLHVVTRLFMVKFVYAERLALYLLEILFTHLYKRIKNNELKLSGLNPTPVYLEQL